jgi:acetyl esterase/lipase
MGVWNMLQPDVLSWLKAHRPLRIVLSGHSLGGALAVLAAYDLAADWTIEEVTVFGCPRVGTPGFASDYASRKCGANTRLGDVTTRYVHSTDVISRIPPPWFWYKHVGQPIYLDEEGSRMYSPRSYHSRVLDTSLDPTDFQTSNYAYKPIRSITKMRSLNVSVLSTFRRSVALILTSGLIPLWAVPPIVIALSLRFVLRDIDYFHDTKRYVKVIRNRQKLIERSPTSLHKQL